MDAITIQKTSTIFKKIKTQLILMRYTLKKIALSNKTPNGEHGPNKYYIAYLSGSFKPLYITIKNIKLYTNDMSVLANDNELLKYNEIWNKIGSLFNKKFNKKEFYSKPTYNNEYIKTKISPYNKSFHDFKKLTKDEYCGHSILLLESISEVKNKYYPQTLLNKFFKRNSAECNNNKNSLFEELVQIVDWSNDESSDES